MEEIWKPIPGYERIYEASSLGRIRSIDRISVWQRKNGTVVNRPVKGREILPQPDGRKNYHHVNLCKNGKQKICQVHRLIANTFIPNPNNYPEVNHIDENKTNNAVSNLEWCDHKYNNNYGSKLHSTRGSNNPQSKISSETVKEIRALYKDRDKEYGLTPLVRKYGISVTHMCAILKGRRWGWLE